MKRICLFLCFIWAVLFIRPCFATSYGDLYDVEWCPCDPEEQFDAQGSVVLGRTVMCPCESMYRGYGRTFKKDVQEAKRTIKRVKEKASNYKYYIGVDFNKSTTETTNDVIRFDPSIPGTDIPAFGNPIEITPDKAIADQDNIGIVIGTRPHPNFGIELFYNRSFDDNETINVDFNALGTNPGDPLGQNHLVNSYITKYQAFGVDIFGYLPITDFFDFVAFVGLGQYYFDNEVTHNQAYSTGGVFGDPYVESLSSDFSEDTLAWRVGLGAQVNIVRGLVLRALYRYIDVNTTAIKNIQEFSVGVQFVF